MLTFTQIPQPMHSSSLIQADLLVGVASTHNLPAGCRPSQQQVCLTRRQPVPLRGCTTLYKAFWEFAEGADAATTSVLRLVPLLLNKSSADGTHQSSPQGSSSCTPADTF